jgi:hypothetical protein
MSRSHGSLALPPLEALAVSTSALPARMTEVDARSIVGHGGTVALYLSVGAATQEYVVVVENAAGETLAEIPTDTRSEALDAYRHPFARPDVPDLFNEA